MGGFCIGENDLITPVRDRKRGALSCLLALVRGARPGTAMRQLSSYAPRFSAQRLVLRFALAYELIREVCSVPHCILEMHDRSVDEQGWRTKRPQAFPVCLQDVVTQARSWGIQSLRSRRPWLGAFGVALYLEGLEAGALLQLHNPCMAESRISDPLVSPELSARYDCGG
jgi:hypothetical protein